MNATIVRVRLDLVGVDVYGDPIYGAEARVTIDEAFVAPRESGDLNDPGRQGVIVGLTLYAPYGTDLRHTDMVEVDGVMYVVDGEVGSWKQPFSGWEAGVTAALVRVEG